MASDAAQHTIVGHYRIQEKDGRPHLLGAGGQGSVYLAVDTRLGRKVALKRLDARDAPSTEAVGRLTREAEITSRLDHPGICAIYDVGVDGRIPYVVMRFVEGETLARKIDLARRGPDREERSHIELESTSVPTAGEHADQEGVRESAAAAPDPSTRRIEINRILQLLESAARALHVAHDHGIIHRDIKPSNIMVTPANEPVILDFGLAKELESGASVASVGLAGTYAYMSPEQLLMEHVPLDRRADVWSLGVTLYECLTLRRPFEGATHSQLMQAIQTKEPPSPRKLNPGVTEDLRVVLATAMEKDRDRRYATALAFAEDLRRVRAHEPILAKPVGPWVRFQRWVERRPGLAAAVIGAFVALAGGLAVSLTLYREVQRERDRAEAALEQRNELEDVTRLAALRYEADQLWPAMPERVEDLERWLDEADRLVERVPHHERAVAQLASGGPPRPESRATWRSPADQRRLSKYLDDVKTFVDPARGPVKSMRERLEFARTVSERSIDRYESKWREAIRSIADAASSPRYAGLKVEAQIGLIPVGKDAASGLWEFVDLQTAGDPSAPLPIRNERGAIAVDESTGIIFVLIPAATSAKPSISPFFLSKYEMTQAQWQRLAGSNPSGQSAGKQVPKAKQPPITLAHPVESVSWSMADGELRKRGHRLPTREEWAHAARGGATTRWPWGEEDACLEHHANIADRAFGTANNEFDRVMAWDDGYATHGPVGSFDANDFGLHDMIGNVAELTASLTEVDEHIYLGGSFRNVPIDCQAWSVKPLYVAWTLGVRPARSLDAAR